MKETCDFCGAVPHVFHGDIAHCGSDACQVCHDWAMWEPRLLPWMDPTPMQRLGGWLMTLLLAPIWRLTPAGWIIDASGWRQRFAIAVYASAYYWAERSGGVL